MNALGCNNLSMNFRIEPPFTEDDVTSFGSLEKAIFWMNQYQEMHEKCMQMKDVMKGYERRLNQYEKEVD